MLKEKIMLLSTVISELWRTTKKIMWCDLLHFPILSFQLLVSGRRFNNLTSIYLARHTPTGTQVAVRITDLESCSEEHLKALQVKQQHFWSHFWTRKGLVNWGSLHAFTGWLNSKFLFKGIEKACINWKDCFRKKLLTSVLEILMELYNSSFETHLVLCI